MLRKMKFILLVMIFVTLMMDETVAARRKKSVSILKHKQDQEKYTREKPKEVKLGQNGKKPWKEVTSTEKKSSVESRESQWKDKIQKPDNRGKRQHVSSVTAHKKVDAKPKKLEKLNTRPKEEIEEENGEEKAMQVNVEQNDPQMWEDEEDHVEEFEEGTADECLDNKYQVSRSCDTKTKESILIQEDLDGKCYYQL